MAKQPDQKLLQLGEMLQELMLDLEVEQIAAVVAETAIAAADSSPDKARRAELLWYGKQFRKLAQGPPERVEPIERPHGRAALELAFVRLTLRANRMASATALPPEDLEWCDHLSRELGKVATEMGL